MNANVENRTLYHVGRYFGIFKRGLYLIWCAWLHSPQRQASITSLSPLGRPRSHIPPLPSFVSLHSLPMGPSTYNGLSSFSSTTGHFYVNSPSICQKGCELIIVKKGVRSYFNYPYQRGGGALWIFFGGLGGWSDCNLLHVSVLKSPVACLWYWYLN